MMCVLCIQLILMHFVEINIWIFVCIFYLLKDISNHENVLLASPLHPADLGALFWKTLKNVQHMPYLIFAYWGLIFFLVAQIFYERYQQIIITCGADVKYQVWQMPNVLFLRYCYVQVLPTIKKCQIIADQLAPVSGDIHTYYTEMIEELASTKNYSTIHLFGYFIMYM